MARDEKERFYERIEGRVNLNPDLRAGLREAILTNQTLKALVYIEMLFEQVENNTADTPTETVSVTEDAKPKTTKKAPTTQPKTAVKEGKEKDDTE